MEAEEKIRLFLEEDKALIDNPDLPIHTYNYSAINDRLKENGILVSTTTVINRARSYGYYVRRKKNKAVHDREVLTSAVGDLIQHDASIHKWSPFANEKWTLITSLDDYSRMLKEKPVGHIFKPYKILCNNMAFHTVIMLII